MPPEPPQEFVHETDGVLVRPVGGQIYLVEEGDERAPCEDEPAPDRSPLSGLINRH
jgi:hypothetical protein